jgi:putative zinc finger/helix-turn-helix YgiT family protein
MTCKNCEARMTVRRESHQYTESGLPNVTLLNIEVRHCPNCGAREFVIPRIDELHKVLARAIAMHMDRLAGNEIRFLRKYLGWSGVDFAQYMGVAPETVSRWEQETQEMSRQADRLLRLFVANHEPVESYPVELFREGKRRMARAQLRARLDRSGWATETDAA